MSTPSQSHDANSPGPDMDPGSKPAANQRSLKIFWIISLAVLVVVVFCGGFVFFYLRHQQKPASQSTTKTPHPLPEAKLIDESNQQLPDSELRHGRLILVFITPACDACMKESQFLRTVVGKYNRIPFYGVVSFGDKDVAYARQKTSSRSRSSMMSTFNLPGLWA
jgi:hypothetical protein